jgi:adenine-specific DNA methylase
MTAVIIDTPSGKEYRPVEFTDREAFDEAQKLAFTVEKPSEPMTDSPDTVAGRGWNFKIWGSLFNPRQLLAMHILISYLNEAIIELGKQETNADYRRAIMLYLGLFVSKISVFLTTFGKLNAKRETLDQPFGEHAIPMKWDFPEVNPFNTVTGGALSQLDWIIRVITHESFSLRNELDFAKISFGDSARLALASGALRFVVTDPPYFDLFAYADLSDFFYIWLKRALSNIFPEVFITPLTPKSDEATALKHQHDGNKEKANRHYVSKLSACFAEAKRVCKPDGIITVMFAHQATEAWTALINALFEAGLNIVATYPIETEMKNRMVALGASALESSITVACRPRQVGSASSFRDVRREIENVVADSVHRFWDYGFRGADLIVACYGPAVGVFGKYERVERADGTPVTVPDLLELAKESALKAIAGEFTGDSVSRLYFVWANLYGTSQQAWDDARLVAQVGGDSEDAMELARRRDIFVVDGSNCRLALLRDRIKHHNLGESSDDPLIDQLHHAMQLWKEERRPELINYLREHGLIDHPPFWKLAQALFEVMPRDEEDWKLINVLLGEREALRIEARRTTPPSQEDLF